MTTRQVPYRTTEQRRDNKFVMNYCPDKELRTFVKGLAAVEGKSAREKFREIIQEYRDRWLADHVETRGQDQDPDR